MAPLPPGITVCRLGPGQAEAYRELMLEGYARHPDAFSSSAAERAALPLAWWQARVAAGDDATERVLGALQADGTLAGVAGLRFETGDKLRHKAALFGMYVPQRWRGHGLGAALVAAVLDAARARPGLRLVQLTVSEGNGAAQALYARHGFVPFGVEPMAMALDGRFIAKHHLWCDLAP